MPFSYFQYVLRRDPKWALIEFFPGVQRDFNLAKGVRMGSDFPPSVELSIAPDSGNLITDFIPNVAELPIVSGRVREVLEAEGVTGDEVEYLPFVLRDKAGRVVEEARSCVVNPLRKVPCLDRQRASFRTRADKVTVVLMKVLQLLPDRIPEEARLFRLAELPSVILLRSDLVKRLQDAGVTGLSLAAPGEDLRA